jgi:hypothetical protein
VRLSCEIGWARGLMATFAVNVVALTTSVRPDRVVNMDYGGVFGRSQLSRENVRGRSIAVLFLPGVR